VPLMWRYSLLSRVSLGISLGYFLLDALLVAWYMPAVATSCCPVASAPLSPPP